ncbi:MAG: pyridine nucleotide-disulfide oxidoreductase, partial [Spirochaetes bacterium]|nr:pyridine nucleotide-disulfide oxidoreductase [Spirochaetota bacterium]
ISGTEKEVECDTLILSVGLIPENDMTVSLSDIQLDAKTKGPFVDQNMMTQCPGVFSCGNALHVNDLVDYVSENGETAGYQAALFSQQGFKKSQTISIKTRGDIQYVVPQTITAAGENKAILYFRSKKIVRNASIFVKNSQQIIFQKKYPIIKPPEMERIVLDTSLISFQNELFLEMEVCPS